MARLLPSIRHDILLILVIRFGHGVETVILRHFGDGVGDFLGQYTVGVGRAGDDVAVVVIGVGVVRDRFRTGKTMNAFSFGSAFA